MALTPKQRALMKEIADDNGMTVEELIAWLRSPEGIADFAIEKATRSARKADDAD